MPPERTPPGRSGRSGPPRGRGQPRGALADDETAVSEIIGYILVFAIVAVLLILGMLAFNKAQNDARRNVIDLRAQSAATRVSSLVVEASLLAETQGTTTAMRFLAPLPEDLEGFSYTVAIEPAANGNVERVHVVVAGAAVDVTAPIFSASAPLTVDICPGPTGTGTSARGGHISIAFNVDTYPTQSCLFVEPAA
ncbi:MAG: hypothetical protein V4510_02595 [bacterium]